MFIHKLDGLMWFCINFWKINAISKFNMYPMPRVNELLGILEAAKYISTLNLTKGYWQIRLTSESIGKKKHLLHTVVAETV